jgi:hypothetical protein
MDRGIQARVAAVALTIGSALLPGCGEERGKTTEIGPNPMDRISTMSPDMAEVMRNAHHIFQDLARSNIPEQIKQLNVSDSDLIDARKRAKDFADSGQFFGERTYLPGGIYVVNQIEPGVAQEAIEGVLKERGVSF